MGFVDAEVCARRGHPLRLISGGVNATSRSLSPRLDRMVAQTIDNRCRVRIEAAHVLGRLEVNRALSDEHRSADGMLVEELPFSTPPADSQSDKNNRRRARPKSVKPGELGVSGRNGSSAFHGARRANQRLSAITNAKARLFRGGTPKDAKLTFMRLLITSHRGCNLEGSNLRRPNCGLSQRAGKWTEEPFGRLSTIAGAEQTRLRGRNWAGGSFAPGAPTDDLVPLPEMRAVFDVNTSDQAQRPPAAQLAIYTVA